MTAAAMLVLSLAGFAALAVSMNKHHRDLFGKAPSRSREWMLRGGGWLGLGGSLFWAIADGGVLVGIVLWLGVATVAALAVAMMLAYAPRTRA